MNDVEMFKHKDGKILELGGRPKSPDEILVKYIGMLKIVKELLIKLLDEYVKKAKQIQKQEGVLKDHKNMYMTDFIQNYINDGGYVETEFINDGWLEVDTVTNINRYCQNSNYPMFKGLLS
jgi:L-glutamine-phosphate cytidylyltransferase